MTYEFIYSPHNRSRNSKDVDGIILHYTRGGDAKGTINWFKHPDSKVSAHYVVSRSGKIVQMVKEDRAAWHAGSPTTTPSLNGRTGLNSWTIGIEICNWGPLYRATGDAEVTLANGTIGARYGGKTYCAGKRWTMEYRGPEPETLTLRTKVITKDKYWPGNELILMWEPFPSAQLTAVKMLLTDILDRYPHITAKWIARHQDVDIERKLDTGPAFPFSSIREEVLGLSDEQEESESFQLDKEDEIVSAQEMADNYEPRHEPNKKKFWCFT